MAVDDVVVRRATKADAAAAGRFGAALAAAHAEWDPKRFFVVEDMADGYAWWLGKELDNADAVVLVAERAGALVGFAYGRVEERDWNSLRERCGLAIDLYVDPAARGQGAGRALALALIDALKERGVPFVILQVAWNNQKAQAFFRALGARPTLVEMAFDVQAELKGPRKT